MLMRWGITLGCVVLLLAFVGPRATGQDKPAPRERPPARAVDDDLEDLLTPPPPKALPADVKELDERLSKLLQGKAGPPEPKDKPANVKPLPPPPLTPAELKTLIAQLDAESYAARQQATRKLAHHGAQIVPQLRDAAANGSLELKVRVIDVLQQLGGAGDESSEEAAFAALDQLRQSPSSSTSSRATEAIKTLNTTRPDRVIARIKQQGGEVGDVYLPTGLGGRVIGAPGMPGKAILIGPGMFIEDGSAESSISVTLGQHWKGGRDGLRLLRRMPKITQLVLEGSQVTDDWLADIGGLASLELQFLTLKRTKVTDAGLAHLTKMESLSYVDILYSKEVTDAGAEKLGDLKKLQMVRLFGTKVSQDAAEKLNKALGGDKDGARRVDRRSGALLGVSGSLGDDGCAISTVAADSAAEKAGLREGDVITKFDGKNVRNFTELTAAIAEKSGGDTVKVDLIRETRSLTLEVKLGEW